jgi:hypothetical protein
MERWSTMAGQKKNEAQGQKTVLAVIGQPIQISLQSMVGSTGYGWYLTSLDDGVALSSAVIVPTATGIAPVIHQFDFIATKTGTFKVQFQLLAPWRPGEPGDTELYVVTVSAPKKSAKEEIEAQMAGRDFIRASSVNLGQSMTEPSTVLKYAAPMAQAAPSMTVKYAAPMVQAPQPQPIIYAAPMTRAQSGTLSAATMIAYAAPVGPTMVAATGMQSVDPCLQSQYLQQNAAMMQPYAAPWPNTQLLYAAPMTASGQWPCSQPVQPMYAAPMVLRYAAPYNPGCC